MTGLHARAARLPGRIGQLLRYATVSAIATGVGLSVLGVLVGVAGMPAGWANVVATAIGAVPSFELNRRWVWGRRDRSILGQAVPFAVLALVELVASTLAVHAAGAWAQQRHSSRPVEVAVVLAANVAAFGTLWVTQFVVCDRVLFGRRAKDRAGTPGRPRPGTAARPPTPGRTRVQAPEAARW